MVAARGWEKAEGAVNYSLGIVGEDEEVLETDGDCATWQEYLMPLNHTFIQRLKW